MSELQIALLSIGLVAIVAVYLFGWWQQNRYRQKFGETFRASHVDALYHGNPAQPPEQSKHLAQAEHFVDEVLATGEEHLADAEQEEACALLDARSDFIIEVQLIEPSPPAVLVGLWQRKFDFGKTVQVCGLKLAAPEWERVIAESHTLYKRFRIALQLVDRSGAISVAKLADFSDLVVGVATHIKAQTTVPDLQATHQHALQQDAFCAAVDQMVGVNLMPPGDRLIKAINVVQIASQHGMTLEADGAFHLLDAQGHSLFRLMNQDTVPFQHHTLDTFFTAGITLLLDVPSVEDPALRFDQMMEVVNHLAGELQLNVVDDHRVALDDIALERTRAQIVSVEKNMRENGIAPGSALARRLFS